MGLFNWFKGSDEEAIHEGLSNDRLANDKWIEHYFKVGFEKQKKEDDKTFAFRIENIKLNLLNSIVQMLGFSSIKTDKNILTFKETLKKNVTIKVIEPTKKHYEFIIRFPDSNDKDMKRKTGIIFRERKSGSEKDYLFSPLQEIILNKLKVLPSIESYIMNFLNIEPPEVMKQNKIIKQFYFIDDKLYYKEFDGIQYFGYPIKKRLELYTKNHKLEKIVFPTIDKNFSFKDFVEEVMSKKNEKNMSKYCKAFEKLLKEYKIQFK